MQKKYSFNVNYDEKMKMEEIEFNSTILGMKLQSQHLYNDIVNSIDENSPSYLYHISQFSPKESNQKKKLCTMKLLNFRKKIVHGDGSVELFKYSKDIMDLEQFGPVIELIDHETFEKKNFVYVLTIFRALMIVE